MVDNWDRAQPNEGMFPRQISDFTTAIELKGINTTLAEIKEDIKKVDNHERQILDLQYAQKAQGEAITALTVSIKDLTKAVKDTTESVAALTMKFFTGVAWVGGATAVVTVIYVLLSSGFLHFGGGK